MYDEETLEAAGHLGKPVPNQFFRQRDTVSRLAIVLPGYAYTVEMPLLYYPTTLFLENRFDVLHVCYGYQSEASFRLPVGEEERRWLFADVSAAVRAGRGQRDYADVVVVGQSLGTLAMGYLVTAELLPPSTKWSWMSALFKDAWLGEQIIRHAPPSLFIVGTADPHYRSATREQVDRAGRHEWLVLQDARHDLEIARDIPRSLQALEQVVCTIARFSGCEGCEAKEQRGVTAL